MPPQNDDLITTKSILITIKKMLGLSVDHTAFDLDVVMSINATFLTLNQLGIGPRLPYAIYGYDETWSDFLGEQEEFLAAVQTYVYMRVRLMFDPPTNSFLVDSMQKQIQEFEWRFSVQPTTEKELGYVESFGDYSREDSSEDDDNEDADVNNYAISTFSMNRGESVVSLSQQVTENLQRAKIASPISARSVERLNKTLSLSSSDSDSTSAEKDPSLKQSELNQNGSLNIVSTLSMKDKLTTKREEKSLYDMFS